MIITISICIVLAVYNGVNNSFLGHCNILVGPVEKAKLLNSVGLAKGHSPHIFLLTYTS